MHLRSIAAAAAMLMAVGAAEPAARQWDFEGESTGALPKNWTADKTGSGPGSVWKVVEDPTAPHGSKVLAQTSSDGPRRLFNLCIADNTSMTDVEIKLAFKAVEGEIDQGGGPVWRYRDANNYYIARMNPLEANFRVYKVVAGKRVQLGTADDEASVGKWHTLRIVHRGNRIICHLNGKKYLDVQDDTFAGAGKIGLWTKADAVTYFDGITVNVP